MRTTSGPSMSLGTLLVLASAVSIAGAETTQSGATTRLNPWSHSHRYIVQSTTALVARQNVVAVGGEVSRDLPVINGVAAELNAAQAAQLGEISGVRLFEDRSIGTRSGDSAPAAITHTDGTGVNTKLDKFATNYPLLLGATLLLQHGITGKGITIAVLDTRLWTDGPDNFKSRVLASIDLVDAGSKPVTADPYGHGTHVASIAASGAHTLRGTSFGIAPAANLVIVHAFDGVGSYTNVIAGINWILQNQQKYKIRVLNLSFGAPPQSNYWDDPLNQAVMAAWKAGIVVVVSAGNEGPNPCKRESQRRLPPGLLRRAIGISRYRASGSG